MTSREHRVKKKKWREYARQRVEKNKLLAKAAPPSPPSSNIATPGPSGNSLKGKSKIHRYRSKTVRENKRLRKENEELLKRMERYRKRLQRAKTKDSQAKAKLPDEDLTPSSKATRLLSNTNHKDRNCQKKVYRMLVFHNALVRSLRAKYQQAKRDKKKVFADVVSSTILKKYRMQTMASKALGLSESRKKAKERTTRECEKKDTIQSFFVKDDISRATAGKKETVTRKKDKKQIRYLTDTMKHLYQKFLEESGLTGKVSYTTFTRCRPFYVRVPREENRDTCLCKLHSNLSFKAKKLRELKVVETENIHQLVHTKTCDKNNAKCMYNMCDKCKNKKVPVTLTGNANNPLFWWQWDTITEEREKLKQGVNQQFKVKVTVKRKNHGTVAELEDLFQKEMQTFKTHTYNIRQQNLAYNSCKDNMQKCEALLHVDFSENYNCKLSEEVQSYHFGASRSQVSLHTGVLYIGGNEKPIPFCSISASTDHSPPAIWAHLDPVFQFLRQEAPDVKVLHFFTDGPSTQYRQKKNFFMFSTHIFDLGFQLGTGSYFEAGHGKGAADGIGAVIKRTADSMVAHGHDIPDALALYQSVKKETSVKLFFVTQDEVDALTKDLPTNLVALKGTRMIHQLFTSERGKLNSRNVSCYCEANKWLENVQCSCNFAFKKNVALVKQPILSKGNAKQKKRLRYNEVYSSSEDELEEDAIIENINQSHLDKPVPEEPSNKILSSDYILAEYPLRSKVHYVGKVLRVNGEKLTVDFLRKIPGSTEIPTFVQPKTPDIEDIEVQACILKLHPTFLRRGRVTFGNNFKGFTVK